MPSLFARAHNLLTRPTGNLLARSVVLNMLGRGGSLVVGFFTSIALARWLGPSDRGLLALMLSVGSLTFVLTAVGMHLSATYYASRRDADRAGIFGNCLVHAAVLTLLIPVTLLVYQPVADAVGEGQGGRVWVLAAALVPITFLDWTTHGQLQGMLRFGRFNLLVILSKVAYAIGIFILLGVLSLGITAGLISTAAGSAVMILGSLRPILSSGRPRIDIPLFRQMLRYGSRVQIGAIFQMANGRLDVIILQLFRPLSQVGYYVVAQSVAELVIAVATAFQASVLPLVSYYEGDARQDSTSADSIRHHGILAGVAAVGNAVFGSALILFAYGTQFHPAVLPMLILLPGVWFLGMGLVIQGDLGGRGRPGLSSRLGGLAAGVTVILDFALIPPFGVIGAALASVASYTTFGFASVIALHRTSQIPLRRLVVPTQADLAAYGRAVRSLLAGLRPSPGSAD